MEEMTGALRGNTACQCDVGSGRLTCCDLKSGNGGIRISLQPSTSHDTRLAPHWDGVDAIASGNRGPDTFAIGSRCVTIAPTTGTFAELLTMPAMAPNMGCACADTAGALRS